MNKPRLQRIELSNFRSIRGCIDIPLDAEIVLIHGPNGTGKTSLLSGLELGLTGKISTLASMSDNYAEHLLHEGTLEGGVRLEVSAGTTIEKGSNHTKLSRHAMAGEPLLSPALGQFFTERSYLAQSTLGRLLELYQVSDKRGDSLLTRFVNDLLGLDQLDALIEGLEKSGDIRATRKLITELGDQERLAESLRNECEAIEHRVAASEREVSRKALPAPGHPMFPADIDGEMKSIEDHLEMLLPQLTEVRKLHKQFSDATVDAEAATLRRADVDHGLDSLAWSEWSGHWGERLHEIGSRAYTALGIEGPKTIENPVEYVASLADLLRTSITSVRARVKRNSDLERHTEQMRVGIAHLEERRTVLDSRKVDLGVEDGVADLGHALASLLPHINDDLCPTCGRDFQEVSEQHLIDRVREAATALNRLAEQRQKLITERHEIDERYVELERSINSTISQLDPPHKRTSLEAELRTLADIETEFCGLEPQVSAGSILWQTAEASAIHRASLEVSNLRLSAMHERVQEIAQANNYSAPIGTDWLGSTARLAKFLDEQISSLNDRRTSLRAFKESRLSVDRLNADTERLRAQLQAAKESLGQVQRQSDAAKSRIDVARAVMKAAVDVRQSVVAEVFDAKLNDTWKDLFIKLAPGEPFTPQFVVKPQARARAGAELQVVHRNAKRSGPPGALLSAGNLNTAALTLFLSLHLAAESKLPWLILDDPVQAMDDIHISHFAALLRSFAHDLSRQVVIAVHERSLFDYLALELSPAMPGQRLVTVELSRKSVGDTSAAIETIEWDRDRAIV